MKRTLVLSLCVASSTMALANSNYFNLSLGDFAQDWSNGGLITENHVWDNVPSIMGFIGNDDTANLTGVDPRDRTSSYLGNINVWANQSVPNTYTSGGVAEFDGIANPTIALNGSGSADFPSIVLYMNATGRMNVTLSFDMIDLDGSADNAIQPIAVQYRIGNTSDFTNVPGGYWSDVTLGPNLSGNTTFSGNLSMAAWSDVSELQLRILTTNAVGNDEWVGIDNIRVTSQPVPEPGTMVALGLGLVALARRRRK